MSKFGWSYPPGVTESMLPGNSPAEQEAEAFAEAFFEQVAKEFGSKGLEKAEHHFDALSQWLWQQMGEAYAKGYAQGQADEALARQCQIEKEGSTQ